MSAPVAWCATERGQVCKRCERQRGSATRKQCRAYALAVTVALMGRAACPHCDAPVTLWEGEVDRTLDGVCYAPGNVTMTCRPCNAMRGNLPNGVTFNSQGYASAVALASERVDVPRVSDAVRAYDAQGRTLGSLSSSPWLI